MTPRKVLKARQITLLCSQCPLDILTQRDGIELEIRLEHDCRHEIHTPLFRVLQTRPRKPSTLALSPLPKLEETYRSPKQIVNARLINLAASSSFSHRSGLSGVIRTRY